MTHHSELLDLDVLETLAKAATPGPWELSLGAAWCVVTEAPDWEQREVSTTGPDGSTGSEDDAAFIAASDPPTILALIGELRRARACIASALEVGAQTGYSHHKEPVMKVLGGYNMDQWND